ncbi:hypothetical protein PAXINDRAFT_85402, partial [Paxillus involutus ATCC 200175]
QSSILVWLCMKHISLNAHLHHLMKADSPFCSHCPDIKKNVMHYVPPQMPTIHKRTPHSHKTTAQKGITDATPAKLHKQHR